MSISYVAKGAFATTAISSVSVGMPSGIQENDFLLLLITDYTSSPSLPSGWTNIGTSSTTELYTRVCYKIAAASNSAVTVSAGAYIGGQVFAFRGVDTSSPINVNTSNTDSGTTFSANGVTTTVAGAMIVVAVGFSDQSYTSDTSNFSSWANSNLASITEAEDTADGTSWMGIALAYGIKTDAGDTGATTATTDSSRNQAFAFTIALAPAAESTSVSVTSVSATCDAAALAPVVTGNTNVSVPVSPAPAVAMTPTVTAEYNTSVSGVLGAAAAAALAPAIFSAWNINITASPASVNAQAEKPSVTSAENVITPAIVAEVVVGVLPPAVFASRNAVCVAAAAAATCGAPAPSVTFEGNATASAGVAIASAAAMSPNTNTGSVIAADPSAATAYALPPSVASEAVIPSKVATAATAAIAPAVLSVHNADITCPAVYALATANPPTVTGAGHAVVLVVRAIVSSGALTPAISASRSVEVAVNYTGAAADALPTNITVVLPVAFWGETGLETHGSRARLAGHGSTNRHATHDSLALVGEHASAARLTHHQSRAWIEVYDMIYTHDHFRAHALFKAFPVIETAEGTGDAALVAVPYDPDIIALTVTDKGQNVLYTYAKADMSRIATGHYIIDIVTPNNATRLYLEWSAQVGFGDNALPIQCESSPPFVEVMAKR